MSNIELGKVYNGTVKSIRNFGVFVECVEGEEGLVHISELDNCRIDRIEDVCKVGDKIAVKCIGFDDRQRVRLSRRAVICEEQGLPYEIREIKAKRFSNGNFGNRSFGRDFGPKQFNRDHRNGNRRDSGRSFGNSSGGNFGKGFGHARRPSEENSDFMRNY